MKNRISSYAGMDWIVFLVKQRLIESGEPVVGTLERMHEYDAFFQMPPIRYEAIEEWKERFGGDRWKTGG
jgi:hypothetical protein